MPRSALPPPLSASSAGSCVLWLPGQADVNQRNHGCATASCMRRRRAGIVHAATGELVGGMCKPPSPFLLKLKQCNSLPSSGLWAPARQQTAIQTAQPGDEPTSRSRDVALRIYGPTMYARIQAADPQLYPEKRKRRGTCTMMILTGLVLRVRESGQSNMIVSLRSHSAP